MSDLSDVEIDALADLAGRLADAAGRASLPHFRADALVTDNKLDGKDFDPVTVADRAAEQAIRDVLGQERPDDGIFGEEQARTEGTSGLTWVLDPIDGTAPFIAGIPVYGTLIGLARCGRPWLGVIDHPATSDRWVGVSGEWATLNGAAVRTRRCPDLAPALMTNSNPDFFNGAERRTFEALRTRVRYTQYGGSCYAYGVLASGRTDLAVDGGLDPFDIFAPAAVIEGAGGRITDWSGQRFTLGWAGRVLAAGDPDLHAQALAVLQSSAGSGDRLS